MKDVQEAMTLTNYKQYIEYRVVHDNVDELKVFVHYVVVKALHTEVRTRPLDWKSLANHVGALVNPNVKC